MSIFDFNKIINSLLDINDSIFSLHSSDSQEPISINEDSKIITIYLSSPISPSTCPRCGCVDTHYFKDYRTISLHHRNSDDYKVILVVRYRRYKCLHCCSDSLRPKVFKEDIPFQVSNHRFTSSFVKSIIFHLRENYSLKSIARTHFISYSTVYHLFVHHIQLLHRMYSLPTHLSIDEFKATTGAGKYAFNICDPSNGCVLDILEDRRQIYVRNYFQRFSLEQRKKVQYISMDLSATFKSVMREMFPNAIIVADKFHVVQLLCRNFIAERVRIMKDSDKRKRILFKKYWKLFLKRHSTLDREKQVWNPHLKLYVDQITLVSYLLGLDDELNELYHLYQDFLSYMSEENGNHHIQLREWIKRVRENGNKRFCKVVDTYTEWFEEIIQSKKVKIRLYNRKQERETYLNNGFIESLNNKIKLVKRNAYGYRVFKNLKKRVLIHLGFGFSLVDTIEENIMMY